MARVRRRDARSRDRRVRDARASLRPLSAPASPARADAEHVDVLIAGGGPAGLRAARVAAEAGLRVLLVEREAEIGEPVHTSGGLAIEVMRRFEIPPSLWHPIARVRLRSPNENVVFALDPPVLCVIDVRGTYKHLARVAEAAGARIATGTAAVGLLRDGERVAGCVVRADGVERDVHAKIVIDASGYRAELARAAGLHPGFDRFGVGAEVEMVAPHSAQDEGLLLVGNRYAPAGYAWAFPWGDARLRIGVGLLHSDTREDARKMLERFLADLPSFGIDVRDARITEKHFGLIPAVGLAPRLSGAGIMAVGDAGGVATLVVGEGIRLSLVSGEMAARTAIAALAPGGDPSDLRAYDRAFRARYARDLRIGASMNRRIAAYGDAQWDRAVRVLGTIPANVVAAMLQANFSTAAVLRWFAARPRHWPRLARWTIAALR